MLRLIFQHIGQSVFKVGVIGKALFFGASLDFVLIERQRHGTTHSGNAEIAVAVGHHASLLDIFTESLVDVSGLFCDCGALLLTPIHFGNVLNPSGHSCRLVGCSCREQSHRSRSVGVALLKAKEHFAAHVFGMFNEISVDEHRQVFRLASIVLERRGSHRSNRAYVYCICALAAIHTLTHNDNVRSGRCASECLIVHAEHTDNICTALLVANEPVA